MDGMEMGPDKFKLYGLHKSTGITVLLLFFLRLSWRLYTSAPAYLPGMKPYEIALAKAVHYFLYAAIFVMPMSGWLMSSAANIQVSVFDLFTLPNLIAPDKQVLKFLKQFHFYFAWVIIGAIALHLAGVLKHTLINRDGTLKRMLPCLAVFILLSFPALAEAPVWKIIPEESAIMFKSKQMAAEFEGRFNIFSADIAFDPDDLAHSRVRADIDISSVATGYDERDDNLKKPAWFDVAAFPAAVFESSSFEKTPEGYIADGTLTIKGVSKNLKLPFKLTFEDSEKGKLAHMTAEITLHRLDFGLGTGDWEDTSVVPADVPVRLVITAQKQ
jgi:cytochrome b561